MTTPKKKVHNETSNLKEGDNIRDCNEETEEYKTIQLFDDLYETLSQIAQVHMLSKSTKTKGKINKEIMNEVLGFGSAFIRTKRRLIEKGVYPYYKLSVVQINKAFQRNYLLT